jgi:hypothetical protein|tara:strand:+ start:266 stop:382 length:117 start_codon:yes stop_codon:yes gene_type:complete
MEGINLLTQKTLSTNANNTKTSTSKNKQWINDWLKKNR